MNNSLTQKVCFRGGTQDGKTANVTFALPFSLDATISFPDDRYRLVRGPIAQQIARTQEPVDYRALSMILVDTPNEVG